MKMKFTQQQHSAIVLTFAIVLSNIVWFASTAGRA